MSWLARTVVHGALDVLTAPRHSRAMRQLWAARYSARHLGRVALALSLSLIACKDPPKSTRWDEAGATATAGTASTTEPKVDTGILNAFFPGDGEGGYKRVFTADRPGYAEAKLQKDGKDVATLTIADSAGDKAAVSKYETATEKVKDCPVVKVGNNQSSALVKARFQVKVSSPTLDHEARKAILSTFDLKGLSS